MRSATDALGPIDFLPKEQQNHWLRYDLNHWDSREIMIPASFEGKTKALDKMNEQNDDLHRLIMLGWIPDIEMDWVKFLVNLQIFGGVGTWEDICIYSGEDPRQIINKYGWINFYLYYNLLKVVKRRKGGRVFELGDSAQAVIDFAVSK